MFFWLLAACLTLAAALAVMLPFLRPPRRQEDVAAHDMEVYRDQLVELDRDLARGTLAAGEAIEARAEIARRILRLEGAAGVRSRGSGRLARALAAVAVLSVPILSWSLYSALGSPGLPSEPLQARLDKSPDDSTIEELVARAERHLAADPEDGRGWDVLAPVYFRLERYGDAVNAYRQAIRLSGASAAREAGLGEAITAKGGGVVSADAEAAFRRAVDLDPSASKPRFFLAMAKAQEGKNAEARAMWTDMQADLPKDSPWRGAVGQALAELDSREAQNGKVDEAAAAPAPVGPDAGDIGAAARMAPEDRMAMIEGMVGKLDKRLREEPGDAAAWQRLVHSYLVLGRKDEARDAATRGVTALGGDTDEARKLQAFAQSQGVATP